MDIKPECGSCRFWKDFNEEAGECHRRAPIRLEGDLERQDPDADPGNLKSQFGIWPSTHYWAWCGEYELDPTYTPAPGTPVAVPAPAPGERTDGAADGPAG